MHFWSLAGAATAFALFMTSGALAGQGAPRPFHRGLNLSSWLANAPRQPLYEHDFAQIRRAGFDHVRLPVNPEYFGFKLIQGRANTALAASFHRVDAAIELARKNGLPVILDIHAFEAFLAEVRDKAWAEDEFVTLWSLLAWRYRDQPDEALAFELMNEPQYYWASDKYFRLVSRLIAAIRAESPRRWIVVEAPEDASIESLEEMRPFDDPRIIYGFHFYEPFLITHQGVHMGFEDKMLRHFHGAPYPARLADRPADFYAPKAPDPAQAARELAQYRSENWDSSRIAERIRQAGIWSERHKAPVICGEFGVLRNHIDSGSRYRWIGDTRAALDANNIGWELWDYSDLFGIARLEGAVSRPNPGDGSIRLLNPQAGKRVIEPEAIAALGLTPVEPAGMEGPRDGQ